MTNKKKNLSKVEWLTLQHLKYEQIKINKEAIHWLWVNLIMFSLLIGLLVNPYVFIFTGLCFFPLVIFEVTMEHILMKQWKKIRRATKRG